ncbi:MAG: hypothetical protein JNL58_13865 [Planctomyces sp.]|nr:hypothetical protein [Planctomyces sp.]
MEVAENAENLPLAERFHAADYLVRELSEHLQQAFLPKLSDLRSASKIYDVKQVTDQAMLDKMTAVLEADEFAAKLFDKLSRYLESIQKETRTIMGVPEP